MLFLSLLYLLHFLRHWKIDVCPKKEADFISQKFAHFSKTLTYSTLEINSLNFHQFLARMFSKGLFLSGADLQKRFKGLQT